MSTTPLRLIPWGILGLIESLSRALPQPAASLRHTPWGVQHLATHPMRDKMPHWKPLKRVFSAGNLFGTHPLRDETLHDKPLKRAAGAGTPFRTPTKCHSGKYSFLLKGVASTIISFGHTNSRVVWKFLCRGLRFLPLKIDLMFHLIQQISSNLDLGWRSYAISKSVHLFQRRVPAPVVPLATRTQE